MPAVCCLARITAIDRIQPKSSGPIRRMSQTDPSSKQGPGLYIWVIRILLLSGAALILAAVLFYPIENIRGHRALKQVQDEMARRGLGTNWTTLIGSPVPAEDNLAMHPTFRGLLDYHYDPAGHLFWDSLTALKTLDIPLPSPPHKPGRGVANSGRTDLAGWVSALAKSTNFSLLPSTVPAPDRILAALQPYDGFLISVDEASQRKFCKFPVRYQDGARALLPHLAKLKHLCQIYSLRSAARLQRGDLDGAFADVETSLRLSDALSSEPLLISQLVRAAQYLLTLHSFWDGMADHQWTEPQLARFQQQLHSRTLFPSIPFAIRGEQLMMNVELDTMRLHPERMDGITDNAEGLRGVFRIAPDGWWLQNQARLNRYYVLLLDRSEASPLLAGSQTGATGDDEDALHAEASGEQLLFRAAGLEPSSPYNILARLFAPGLTRFSRKILHCETAVRLAETACALERHRLAHGSYPDTLKELVRPFLTDVPLDPINHLPLHYQKSADGWFRLYSVAADQRDDQGRPEGTQSRGDWVWPTPVPTTDSRLF